MSKFEAGAKYWAVNTVDGGRAVVRVIGIAGGVPMFEKVRDAGDTKNVMEMDGREFARIAFKDGIYTASSVAAVEKPEEKGWFGRLVEWLRPTARARQDGGAE